MEKFPTTRNSSCSLKRDPFPIVRSAFPTFASTNRLQLFRRHIFVTLFAVIIRSFHAFVRVGNVET